MDGLEYPSDPARFRVRFYCPTGTTAVARRGVARSIAGGLPGVTKVLDIFRGEIDLVMGQIGCPSLSELGPDFLWRDDWTQNR